MRVEAAAGRPTLHVASAAMSRPLGAVFGGDVSSPCLACHRRATESVDDYSVQKRESNLQLHILHPRKLPLPISQIRR